MAYHLDIPPHVAAVIRHLPPEIKRGVKTALRALSLDPNLGDPLQKELDGFWKYRVKRFRIVYAVEQTKKELRIVAVGHRRIIYEDMAERLRRTSGATHKPSASR